MDDLDKQFNGWLEQVHGLIPSADQSSEITAAGAEVLAKNLKAAAPVSKRKEEKYGHLKDNVTFQASDVGGEKNGNSTVGFAQKAYVARWLNDGTIKMPATHWADNVRKESADEVFAAQRKKYDELIGGDSK